jgi:hypothetical protein
MFLGKISLNHVPCLLIDEISFGFGKDRAIFKVLLSIIFDQTNLSTLNDDHDIEWEWFPMMTQVKVDFGTIYHL